jgi:hypothetical protein
VQIYFPQVEFVKNVLLTISDMSKGLVSAFTGEGMNQFWFGLRSGGVRYYLGIICIQIKITIEILRLRYYQSRWVYFWRETAPNISWWWWLLFIFFIIIYTISIYIFAYFCYIYFNTVIWYPRVVDKQFLFKNKAMITTRTKRIRRRKGQPIPANLIERGIFFNRAAWPIDPEERAMNKFIAKAVKTRRRQSMEAYILPVTTKVRRHAFKRYRTYFKEAMRWTYWRHAIVEFKPYNRNLHLIKKRIYIKKVGWRRFVRPLSAFRPNMYIPKTASHADGRWAYLPIHKRHYRVFNFLLHDINTFSGPGMKLFWFFNTPESQTRENIIQRKNKYFRKLLIKPWNRFWSRKKKYRGRFFPRTMPQYYYPPYTGYALKRVKWWTYRFWMTFYHFEMQKVKYRKNKRKKLRLLKIYDLPFISRRAAGRSKMFGNLRNNYSNLLTFKPYILLFIWFTFVYILFCIWICIFVNQILIFRATFFMQKKTWFTNKRIDDVEEHREDMIDTNDYEYHVEQFRLEQTWEYWISFMKYFVETEEYALFKRDVEPEKPPMLPDDFNVLGGLEHYMFFHYLVIDLKGMRRRFKYLIWKNFYMKWSWASKINYHKCRMREMRYIHKTYPQTTFVGKFLRLLNWVILCIDLICAFGFGLIKIIVTIFTASYVASGKILKWPRGIAYDKTIFWNAPMCALIVIMIILVVMLLIKPIPYHNFLIRFGEWHPEWLDVEYEGDPEIETDVVDWEAVNDEAISTIHTNYWIRKNLRRVYRGGEYYPYMYPDSMEFEAIFYDIRRNWQVFAIEMEDGRDIANAKDKYLAEMTEQEKVAWYKRYHRAIAYMRFFNTPYRKRWIDIDRKRMTLIVNPTDVKNNVSGALEPGLKRWKNKYT